MTTNKKDDDKPLSPPSLIDRYTDLMKKYPLIMNGIQSALIAGLAVITSQKVKGIDKIDFSEVKVMMIINFAFIVPVLLLFYSLLDKVPGGTIGKLIVDQLIFSPFFNTAIIGLRFYMLGVEVHKMTGLLIDIVPNAVVSSWLFWIPTRFFMISYVPNELQLVVGNIGSFVWNIIFSMIVN